MKKTLIILYILFFSVPVINAQATVMTADTGSIKQINLGEIVIRASKDNITYKSIPASVSVISANSIDDSEIKTLNDISATVPNFFMPDYGSKLTSPVYIRGIGSRINSPSVGLYVDYVPYFEKAAFSFDFFDIRRIEVLRGPQGTLFGRNTMGGIINIVTTSPMDYSGTDINLSAGTYGTYSASVSHYGKFNEGAGFSVATNYLHNDGFHTNAFTGTKVDRLNSLGLRTRLIFELSRNLTVENIAGIELSRQGGYPYALYDDETGSAEEINYNQLSTYDRNLFSDALLLRYDGDKIDVSSTTSFQYLNDYQGIDQDFTPDSLYFIVQEQEQKMLSQEVVVKSKEQTRYKWLFGAYGFLQAFDNGVNVDVYASDLSYLKTYDHIIDGYALFHQSTLSDFPLKNMSVTAGIRVDYENDRLHYVYDRSLRGVETLMADTIYPALKSLEFIPRFAINYKVKNGSFYSVAARGYKTGGFNSTFERSEDLTFEPEFSWNYEVGYKSPLFENMMYIDFALFYIDWRNQQIYQTVPSGRGSMLKNAGHSVSRGAELSLKTSPIHGFELALSYGYTDARFISYKENETTDYSGNFIPYVPRHTLFMQAGKTISLSNSHVIDKIRIIATYKGNGTIFWNEENSHSQPFYSITDAKISFIRKSLQVDFWIRNLLNTDYEAFYFEALNNKYVQSGRPAHAGVNLSVKF